jgi:hypothetical protein
VVPRAERADIVIGPLFSVDDLRAAEHEEIWQKIADRVVEKIAELARGAGRSRAARRAAPPYPVALVVGDGDGG